MIALMVSSDTFGKMCETTPMQMNRRKLPFFSRRHQTALFLTSQATLTRVLLCTSLVLRAYITVSSHHALLSTKLLLSSCLLFVDPAALCGLVFTLHVPASDGLYVFYRSIWTTSMLTGCQIGCSTILLLISGQSEGILIHVARHSVALTANRIIPKLKAESDAYMGPGPAPANAKKGTVDVHRGGVCVLLSPKILLFYIPVKIHTSLRISCAKRNPILF